MTMNGHWGYNPEDHDFKSTTTLVRNLVDIASKGGNFLLNIGPTELGEIPPESVDRLSGIGEWWKVNGVSIRGTSGSPFPTGYLPWGRCTVSAKQIIVGSTRLYLHVFDWPQSDQIVVPGLFNGFIRDAAAFAISRNPARAVNPVRSGADVMIPAATFKDNESDSVIVLDIS